MSIVPSGAGGTQFYEAFGMLTEKENGEYCDNGYRLYLYEQTLEESDAYEVQLMTVDENGSHTVANKKITVQYGGEK